VTDNFPFLSIADPDQGKVDPNRPKNGFTRKAPGKLGPMQVGKSCQYVENTLNTASVTCADNTWPCSLPASALAGTVEPDNGACGGVQNVRQLIMVSFLETISPCLLTYIIGMSIWRMRSANEEIYTRRYCSRHLR